MEIREAVEIEDPAAVVRWDVSAPELKALLPGIHFVTDAYYTLPVTVLGGLQCMLGFHLRGPGGGLSELELFRTAYPDLHASFREFQQHLERAFGPPSTSESGHSGFPSHTWQLPGAIVVHHVIDRFGPEEHVRIRRTAGRGPAA